MRNLASYQSDDLSDGSLIANYSRNELEIGRLNGCVTITFIILSVVDLTVSILTVIVIHGLNEDCESQIYNWKWKFNDLLLISAFASMVLCAWFVVTLFAALKSKIPAISVRWVRLLSGLINSLMALTLGLILFRGGADCLKANELLWNFGLLNFIIDVLIMPVGFMRS